MRRWRPDRRSGGTKVEEIVEGSGQVGGGSRKKRMEGGRVEERMAGGGGR